MKGLRIGVGLGELAGPVGGLDATIEQFKRAERDGFQTAWVANIFGLDALTLLTLAGRETSRIELGTAVVPTHSRHPLYMAQQAITTQVATGGRLVLGLGPSHKIVIENMLGLSYARVAKHIEEYVTIVRSLVETGKVAFSGELYRVNGSVQINGASPFPVMIGGLGPKMRKLAGAVADGTLTWMTGRRTLAETLVPEIQGAAKAAGRKPVRIACGLPIVVTNDPAGAREAASKAFVIYGQLPSYRAMLDAEGAKGPGDVAIAGDERAVERALEELAAAGVTDFNAAIFPFGPDPNEARERTWKLLAELAKR
jgi:5,10-methylenetetrahydromethanopterin reductase